MSGKLKMTLVILVLTAPVSLWYLWSLTQPGTPSLDTRGAAILETFDLTDDADGDGLSNRDENLWRTDWQNPDSDGDGYLDGEEVLAGHDPTIRGPNDFLDPSKNLTEYTSTLVLGGILSGDIATNSLNRQLALTQVADVVFDEYQKFAMAPRSVNVLVVEDGEDALGEYIVRMEPQLRTGFPRIIRLVTEYLRTFADVNYGSDTHLKDDAVFRTKLTAESIRIQAELGEFLQGLVDIPVPTAMSRPHRNAIVLVQHMIEQVEVSASAPDDPVKGMLANTTLAELVTRTTVGFAYDYFATLEQVFRSYQVPEE